MSLATFFSFKHDKPIAHSHLWEHVGQGLFHGHIYQSIFNDNHLSKWTQYGYTLFMSGSALHAMAHNSFFKRHIEKVEYFRYAVLLAGTFNFLRVFFCPGRQHEPKVSHKNGFFKNFSIRVWNYTPAVLAVVNIAIIALEARERPMKALSCVIGFALSYRDL